MAVEPGEQKARFVATTPNSKNRGVSRDNRADADTPHDMFVVENLYCDVSNRERVEQAAAASIEAIFIILGHSDLVHRQDPVSWDKFLKMPVAWKNRALGTEIDTRKLAARTPKKIVNKTIQILEKM